MSHLRASVVLSLLPAIGSLPLACVQQNPCNEVADEVRDILGSCDVDAPDYADFSDEECTEPRSALADCVLACYQQTSCAALLQGAAYDCIAAKCS